MKYLMLCLICIIVCNTTIFSQDKFGDKNEICSICGEDDRTPFSHPAVGRINANGTAWIAPNYKLVTAKHVWKQRNPDENFDWILEFNVPQSTFQGDPVPANHKDRYVINQTPIDSGGVGYGENDWVVFDVYPNYYTNKKPFEKQEAYLEVYNNFELNDALEIIGYGIDEHTHNKISQKAGGPLTTLVNEYTIGFRVDVEGGNSGGPIFDLNNDNRIIGIVTAPGCNSDPSTANKGITFKNNDFYIAVGGGTRRITFDQQLKDEEDPINWKIYFWGGTSFIEKKVPFTIPLMVGSVNTIRANQNTFINQKYNNWNNEEFVNHHSLTILYNTPKNYIAYYDYIYSGIEVKNSFENLANINPSNDYIKFKDPWYIDYEDPNFSNNRRNRGIDAPFIARESPFNPNVTTVFSESPVTYQGVFLKQGYNENTNIWSEPYYSIAATSQMISINGFDRYFYFQNWEVENPGSAVFQYPNHAPTPVVFNEPDAVIKAVMKSPQLSNDANGFNGNHQTKTVRTDDGFLHMVYESMGKVWYEYSRDNGQSWILGNSYKSLNNGLSAKIHQ